MQIYIVQKYCDGLDDTVVHKCFYLKWEADAYIGSIKKFVKGVGWEDIKWGSRREIRDERCVSKAAIEYEIRNIDKSYESGDWYYLVEKELM